MRLLIFSFLFFPVFIFSQVSDSISFQRQLPAAQVLDQKARYPLRMREVEGIGVFASKKSDVVLPANADANVALNQTRQVFAKVPGLNIWENDGSGIQPNIAVRGLSPNRSWEFNVRQNGYDVSADNFGYPEAYYAPPTEAVERIEIVRGASSLQYGPQVGGLLNYILKKAPSDRKIALESRQTVGSFGLFNTYNSIGGTLGKFSYHAHGQFRRGDGWRDNADFRTSNFHLALAYALGKKAKIGLEATRADYVLQQSGGLTDVQFDENPRQSNRARNWFAAPWTTAALTFDWQPTERTKLQTKLFGLLGERNSIGFTQAVTVRDSVNATLGTQNPRQIDRFDFKNLGLESRLLQEYYLFGNQHALATGFRLYAGDQTRHQRGKGDTGSDFNLDLKTDRFPFEMDFETRNAAVFAENIFRFGRVALIPGLRYEFVQSASEGYINLGADGQPVASPRAERSRNLLLAGIGAEIHVYEHTEFYVNVANSFRPVLYSDLTPAATTDVVDQNLRDARAWNGDFGFRGNWKEWLRFDAGVFYLLYQNRIGTLNRANADGSIYLFRTNLGESRSYGSEIFVEIDPFKAFKMAPKWGGLQVFAALSWVNARYGDFEVTSVKNGQITTSNLDGNRVEYAPAHVHRFGLNYVLRAFSTSFTVNSVASVFADAGNTVEPSANGQTGKIGGYTLADWAATYRFAERYALSAGVNNLFDKKYATRRAGGYPGPGLLPGDGRAVFATVSIRI